ncbi:hypothetical protein THAOC_25981, partial [Thalassiosira oceanica]
HPHLGQINPSGMPPIKCTPIDGAQASLEQGSSRGGHVARTGSGLEQSLSRWPDALRQTAASLLCRRGREGVQLCSSP